MQSRVLRRVPWGFSVLLTIILLAACGGSSSNPTATPSPGTQATPTTAASATGISGQATSTSPAAPATGTAAATATGAVVATPSTGSTAAATTPSATTPAATASTSAATATTASEPTQPGATATAASGGTEPAYLDDRTSPDQLLNSYYNAVNRREYLRAYSYWGSGAGAPQLPAYDTFAAGYANTESVDLTLGEIRSDVGAGQLYYWVPIALDATNTDGSEQFFVGCYKLHLASPPIQTEPPFQPLSISDGSLNEAAGGSDAQDQLATACDEQGGPPGQAFPTATASPTGADPAVYLDDRSTPEGLLNSYYNAINRKEDARAYGYWESGAQGLAPFDEFSAGFDQTESDVLTLGSSTPGAAAGNLYWDVPAVIVSTQTDGSVQTFAGCYRLHLGQPANQGVPPFQPMAIQSAAVQQVDNGASTSDLLAAACQQ